MINFKDKIFTDHAQKRCQQRGIPPDVASFIIDHGDTVYTHKHKKHYVTRGSLKYLRREYPSFVSKYDKQLKSTAVVCSDDAIITVMKINKRLYG